MCQIQRPSMFCIMLSYTPRDIQYEIDFRWVHYTYSELLNRSFKSPRLVLGSVKGDQLSVSNHSVVTVSCSVSQFWHGWYLEQRIHCCAVCWRVFSVIRSLCLLSTKRIPSAAVTIDYSPVTVLSNALWGRQVKAFLDKSQWSSEWRKIR